MEKTLHLVIGASENRDRYSNMAINALVDHHKDVIAIGNRKGAVAGVTFDTALNMEWKGRVDTITLYINPSRQPAYYDYILALHPRRVIFNPGTENAELVTMLEAANIAAVEACTLVMLSIGNY